MEKKQLLIIFVKNIVLGKVKTRLAKSIGDTGAFNVYKQLFNITQNITLQLDVKKHIYFSDVIVNSAWPNDDKFVQFGSNLGERMNNAFMNGFNEGYEQIVLIGSDLPDISVSILKQSFVALQSSQIVFGPAEDGGYYLVGMEKHYARIFTSKPWSQPELLKTTLNELDGGAISYKLLEKLNDIDTIDDLEKSALSQFNYKY